MLKYLKLILRFPAVPGFSTFPRDLVSITQANQDEADPERKKESEVAQSCLTLSDPMDCNLPGSSIHGIFQARILEWVAISFIQEIFLTQGLNPGLSHCRQTLYCLSYQGSQQLTQRP